MLLADVVAPLRTYLYPVMRIPRGGTFRVSFQCGYCKAPYRSLLAVLAHARVSHGYSVASQ